ncbi:Ff.00g040030.m01.CDS01 [Fusarium sp. VM40]|nr:Ff.00g040030.m01.CDS01 [Fusarium sp. VM40]
MNDTALDKLNRAHKKGVILGLADFVANVAKRFSESDIPDEQKKKYLAAAQQFRIPYWDSYRPRAYTNPTFPGVTNPKDDTTTAAFDWGAPQIFTLPEVMVRRLPDNKLISIPNPFFQFKFNPEQFNKLDLSTRVPKQLASVEPTIRHGGSDADATKSMNNRLNSVREDHIRLCLALMEDEVYRNFRTFSTNAVLPKANEKPEANVEEASGSIEDFHGGYHGTIGGNGHMSFISTAAFDPIFWMHHCQIDRLFAIWQAANGDAHWYNELEPEDQLMGKLDLTPFRKWTSENKTADFGYTYPELANGQTGDTVRKDFAEKYEWSRRTTAKPVFGTPPDDMRPIQVGDAQVFNYTSDSSSGDLLKHPGFPVHKMQHQTVMNAITSNPQYADHWYIDVMFESVYFETIFSIIGDVQGQSGEEWSSLHGFVDEQRQLVTSTTPITSLLLNYAQIGKLDSMDEDNVKQFLVKNSKWRVQTVAGEVLDPRETPRSHDFNLSISRKRTPVPRSAGDVQYDTYPNVIEAIIRNSS